jgi:hypothetical protein
MDQSKAFVVSEVLHGSLGFHSSGRFEISSIIRETIQISRSVAGLTKSAIFVDSLEFCTSKTFNSSLRFSTLSQSSEFEVSAVFTETMMNSPVDDKEQTLVTGLEFSRGKSNAIESAESAQTESVRLEFSGTRSVESDAMKSVELDGSETKSFGLEFSRTMSIFEPRIEQTEKETELKGGSEVVLSTSPVHQEGSERKSGVVYFAGLGLLVAVGCVFEGYALGLLQLRAQEKDVLEKAERAARRSA